MRRNNIWACIYTKCKTSKLLSHQMVYRMIQQQANSQSVNLRVYGHFGPKKLRTEDISAPVIIHTQKCLANGSAACIRSFLLWNRPVYVL